MTSTNKRIVVIAALILAVAILVEAPIMPVKFVSGVPPNGGAFTVWKSPLCWVVGTNPQAWVGFTYMPGTRSPLFHSCVRDLLLG
jgi:hypothetical protein